MVIEVRVKPAARANLVVKVSGKNRYQATVTAVANEGKANLAVIKLLADYFNVPQSQIRLKSGGTARTKLFEIDD